MYAIVRVRGLKHVRPEIKAGLKTLNLDRKNHCVLVPVNASTEGVLHQIKDYVAFGTLNIETLSTLLQKRARLEGDKPLSTDFLKAHQMESIVALAKALHEEKVTLKKLGIKSVLRLNSPRKGFGRVGMKQGVGLKGPLGFHEKGLDNLIRHMM